MLKEGDYQLPLEKELKLRVILQEIDGCRDVDQLQQNLKKCFESLMYYQHVCTKLFEQNLNGFMSEILSTMEVEMQEDPDA